MKLKIGSINLYGRKGHFESRAVLLIDELVRESFDIVMFQEVLLHTGRHPVIDLLKDVGYSSYFSSTLQTNGECDYGNAILSKGRFLSKTTIDLPIRVKREPRNAILAMTRFTSLNVVVVCTHLSHGPDLGSNRHEQLAHLRLALHSWRESESTPIILAGDFNMRPTDLATTLESTLSGFRDCHGTADALERYHHLIENHNIAKSRGIDQKIDYILLHCGRETPNHISILNQDYFSYRCDVKGIFPSDHIGIKTTLSIR